MKKLQNNYTTVEQSKRLLELGMLADSADCYYDNNGIRRLRSESWMLKPNFFIEYSYNMPCWSVGRLIEIWEVITEEKWLHETEQPVIEELISNFSYYSYDNDDPLDFSKFDD